MKTDYESPLEHSSSPDGCREDCPACEDERLVAAAPDLLESLEWLFDARVFRNDLNAAHTQALDKCRDAIAKAKGKA